LIGSAAQEEAANPAYRIFVGNLPASFDDEDLREEFAPFGEMKEVKVVLDGQGNSRRFGFVTFEEEEAMAEAIAEMDGLYLDDESGEINVRDATEGPPAGGDRRPRGGGGGGRGGGGGGRGGRPDEANKVYVGGLPWDVDDDTLKAAFDDFGDVRGHSPPHPACGYSPLWYFVLHGEAPPTGWLWLWLWLAGGDGGRGDGSRERREPGLRLRRVRRRGGGAGCHRHHGSAGACALGTLSACLLPAMRGGVGW
jgi:RNA recognition motif-containing protein